MLLSTALGLFAGGLVASVLAVSGTRLLPGLHMLRAHSVHATATSATQTSALNVTGPVVNQPTAVYMGPSDSIYPVLGVSPANAELDVVGRDKSGQWVAISFPAAAQLHGWIPAARVTGLGDVNSLPLASLTPIQKK